VKAQLFENRPVFETENSKLQDRTIILQKGVTFVSTILAGAESNLSTREAWGAQKPRFTWFCRQTSSEQTCTGNNHLCSSSLFLFPQHFQLK